LPRVDIYSFTKAGEPWISTSWLAQTIYAGAYQLAGWAGVIVLTAAWIAATFALLASILSRRIPVACAIVVALAALTLSASHLLARPHVLVLPIMIVWVNGLVSASDRGGAPCCWLLPLMVLWANLHGGFIFGLALVAPFAFDAMWNADGSQRRSLALRWIAFGIGAVAACCATPYGWGSILAARKILGLGDLLHLISEWAPADFSHLGALEASASALVAGAFYCGIRLSPPRIVLVLSLLYMALSHVRNIEIFAVLTPLVMLAPLSSQFRLHGTPSAKSGFPAASAAAVLIAVLGVSTWAFAASYRLAPPATQAPAAAVDMLEERHARHVLNDLPFGGYLIWRGLPPFIDGRAELYGEQFGMAYYRAVELKDVGLFLDMLKRYDIDAVLLAPATPAASLLDHLDGWHRVYADEAAVLHMRSAD
jgi:hypothetical protein